MANPSSGKALSVKKPTQMLGCGGCVGTLLGSLFFFVFAAAGSVTLWFSCLGPLVNIVRARGWESLPCVIATSEVGGAQGDDTFTIAITYNYEVNGRNFTGDKYSFANLKTSGRAGKQKVVDKFPPGLKTTCYVNPADASESVLDRGLQWSMWWGLFSVPFLAVGLGGVVGMYWARNRLTDLKKKAAADAGDDADEDDDDDDESRERKPRNRQAARIVSVSDSDYDNEDLVEEPGPVTLQPESSPMAAFIGLTIFALIFNGVLSIFVFERLPKWLQLDFDFLPDLFILPFVVGGLLIVLAAVRAFLALYNPVPLLTLSRRIVPLGGTADMSWEFQGTTRAIRQLKVTLRGIEEAKYRRGTNTYTDTATFHEEVLHETSDSGEIAAGEVTITIPTDTMHSFSGSNNHIKWQLRVQGEIAMWPDVNSDFPLRVVPHE